MSANPKIKPGQIYRENDTRFVRRVRVLSVHGLFVKIENVETGRKTTARVDRFGRTSSGGYLLESEK